MEPTGFFEIQIEDPKQAREPGSGSPAGATGADRFPVRLGWIQGVPYLIDLGSSEVLVNGAPIAAYQPVLIQAGDTISIGNTHLTWRAGTEDGQLEHEPQELGAVEPTVEGAQEAAEQPVVQVEGSEPEPAEPEPTEPADATLLISKQVVDQVKPETPDATLLVPKRGAKPDEPEVVDETLPVSRQGAKPPEPDVPDPTLLVTGRPAQPSEPGTPGAKAKTAEVGAELPGDTTTYQTAWVDMAQVVEQDTDLEFVSTTILRDTSIPHLVLHLPDKTWEVQLTGDAVTIGRGRRNDVQIADESVSQRHALIERRGDRFGIRDVGSRNGVWLDKQRIEEHQLSDGDVLSVGRAKLVFKGGFTPDDLTLIAAPRIDGKPTRRPVVFVPGLMGSELWLGSERLWPNPRLLLSNVEALSLPGDPRIEARGIVNEVVIVPNLIQLRQYSGMGDYLVSGLGYTRGKDLLEFGYDWRHDVRLAAQRLADAVERWQVQGPVTIIAHSLGTLVTRYYVEKLGGKRVVERIILMGGPHYGTPGGLSAILSGPGMLPFGIGAERMRDVLSTFPSAYQILPTYPCAVDQNGNYIDLLEEDWWLPEKQRPLLSTARAFRRELGTTSSVPTVSVFGYGLKTKLRVTFHRQADGPWDSVDFVEDSAGDQSVPSGSAVLKDSEIHPVFQEHGSLYVDDSVRMRLKVELTRSTTWQGRK